MTKMVDFRGPYSTPTQNVACMLRKQREEQVAGDAMEVKSLLECVSFQAMQGLSFQYHRDDFTATEFNYKCNFNELV